MWPALSVLLFSTAHINQFTFSDAAIPMGFSALGLCLVLGSLVRFRRQWKGVLLGSAAAWFACWSWAQGTLAWPLLIGSMLAVNFWAWRTQSHCKPGPADAHPLRYTVGQFTIVVIAACLSLAPYAAFMLLSSPGRLERPLSLLNYVFIVNAIGFPFVNDIASGTLLARVRAVLGMSGIEAFVFVTGMVYLLARKRPALWRSAAPGLYLAAAGLLSVWQLSVFRSGLWIWYTGIGISFWLGMVGLAYTLLPNTTIPGVRRRTILLAQRVSVAIIIGAVAASLLFNLRYDRKVYFLESRASLCLLRAQPAQRAHLLRTARVFSGTTHCRVSLRLCRPTEITTAFRVRSQSALDTAR
jgi:hypothetical protein